MNSAAHHPDPDKIIVLWGTYCAVEVAIAHETTRPSREGEYGGLAKVIEASRATGADELMKAHHARLAFTGALATRQLHEGRTAGPQTPI